MKARAELFRRISDLDVIPAPSGAGALLLHAEEGHGALVLLGVLRLSDKAHRAAIVTLDHCMQSVFGYPNDEAYFHDPRGAAGEAPGYGFYEVINSTWPARLTAYNQHAFPGRTPSHYAALRHYFIGCRDASAEFLAENIRVEVTTGTYTEAAREALERSTAA